MISIALPNILPVIIAISLSLVLNSLFPSLEQGVSAINYQGINLIIVVCVFIMLATTIQTLDLGKAKTPTFRYYCTATPLTWILKPIFQFFTAYFFFYIVFEGMVQYPFEYLVGMTLMSFAPCTVMVLVWSFLSQGSMIHAYLTTLLNIGLIVLVYPVMGYLYVGPKFLNVSYGQILYATALYFVIPSLLGLLIKYFYKSPNQRLLKAINISALTLNVFTLFTLWHNKLSTQFMDLILVSVPTLVRIIIVVLLSYPIIKKVAGRNAAKSGVIIGTSDNIELAIIVFSFIFGLQSPIFLPVLANILMEIPTMLFIVSVFLILDKREGEGLHGKSPLDVYSLGSNSTRDRAA